MLYQTSVFFHDSDNGNIFMCDTILYKGEPWLVLSWLITPSGEPRKPMRIVRLGAFPHQIVKPPHHHQYSLRNGLPIALMSLAPLPAELAAEVIDYPDVSMPIGTA